MFGRDYKKSTHLWHNVTGLRLDGTTGDGRCRGRCGKGEMVAGYFRHFKALAMEPGRGPQGRGHTQDKNALPRGLLETVLDQAMERRRGSQVRVVVDLCSGFQSWKPVALERGCTYVAVDLAGDRTKWKGGEREGTIVVRWGEEAMKSRAAAVTDSALHLSEYPWRGVSVGEEHCPWRVSGASYAWHPADEIDL